MAPVHLLISSLKRSENTRRTAGSTEPPLDLGATVGIAIGIACVCSFALATSAYYFYHRQQRIMATRARRDNWADGMENGPYGARAPTPRRGLGYVLSMFSSKRRGQSGRQQLRPYLSSGDLRPTPDKEWEALHEPAVELDGGLVRKNTAYSRAEANYSQASFDDAHRSVNGSGSIPSYTPASAAVRNIDSEEGASSHSSADVHKLAIAMPSTTDAAAAPAAWHRKRTGPPPPLTIEPPGMHSQSPMEAYSAYSTYATAQSPYTYCSINVPVLPPLPSHTSSEGFGTRFPYDGEEPLRSADSTRSSHPLQYPPSPQTPGSIPSMSRSDSGGAQESKPLAPPTPTYSLPRSQPSPQRTNIIEATHFECLGPLPDHIEIPSPPYFRTAHQQQQDPFLTPRVHTPEDRSPVGVGGQQESSSSSSNTTNASATAEPAQLYVQDPLLHESNPFRHLPSPVHPTFDRAHSVHAQSLRDGDSCSQLNRRDSTDSLGSNFTVEEEARIQEQIVRNLDALDKERVMGEMDIVHIPQISARRYSWEE